MDIIGWYDFLKNGLSKEKKTACTIGVFDGLHVGHQVLIKKVVNNGKGLHPIVITFSSNPSALLKQDTYVGDLFTLRQKLNMLGRLGVRTTILIDFSPDFSKLTGKDFIFSILKKMELKLLVIGENFHCGRNADTDAQKVKEYVRNSNTDIHVIEPIEVGGVPVSSTKVRNSIKKGEMDYVKNLLGRPYALDLEGIETRSDHQKKFVKRDQIRQLLPPVGTYNIKEISESAEAEGTITVQAQELSWINPDNTTPKYIEFM